MRDKLAQSYGPEGSTVDAVEMVDRLLIIAGLKLRVRLPVASSVKTRAGVWDGSQARRQIALLRLQIEELAVTAVQVALALRQMIEFCLTTTSISGCFRVAGN